MSGASQSDARVWRSHPVRAALVRALVFVIPLLASIAVGVLIGKALPSPGSTPQLVLWWAVVLGASTAAVYGADRIARRLLPLATLMKLSMLFPDRAPSRIKVARRVAGSRAIAAELHRASHEGVTGDRQEAAETILALVGALGDYDSRTRGHSERTQLFVTMLADELHLREEDKGRLMWAALVHDIGKLKVPHEVLNKPSAPTDDEWEILHTHPFEGAKICEPLREWLGEWWFAIEQHHERYDGTGYPLGLAGHEISYGARIVSVADSYEVMTAPRPYKLPMPAVEAREELTRCAGTQFDPDVVRAFLNISLGRTRRAAGPLAWLAQLVMVRPGPVLGQALGAAAGATATTASVLTLSLVPGLTDAAAATGAHHTVSAKSDPSSGGPGDPGTTTSAPAPTGTTDDPSSPDPSTRPGASPTGGSSPSAHHPGTSTHRPGSPRSTGSTRPDGSTPPPGSTSPGPGQGHPTNPDPGTHLGPGGSDPGGPPGSGPPGSGPPGSGPPGPGGGGPNPPPTSDPDPMVARDDMFAVPEDTPRVLDVTANDSAGDVGPFTLAQVSNPGHGTASLTPDGKVLYAPDANKNGPDSLDYTLRARDGTTATAKAIITVTPVNDPPIAVNDAYTAKTLRGISIGAGNGVLANDHDVDGDPLTVTKAVSLLITIHPDGSISFPLPVLGVTNVQYTVSDGTTTATATAKFTVSLFRAAGSPAFIARPDTATRF